MIYRTLIIFLFLVTSCAKKVHLVLPLEKGISLELATYRKQQITSVLYELAFKIPEEKEIAIDATLKLTLSLKNLDQHLYLDFNEESSKIKTLTVNGNKTVINHQKEHLIIDKTELILGKNTIEIIFIAGEKSLNRNEDFLYTLLVPDRASTLFPCFDQPDIKAHYKLKITAPKDWKVLCGAFLENTTTTKNYTTHTFGKTDLMSTYLFSFVAGKFKEETKNPGAFNMRFLYRENNTEKITESVSEIFNIHQKSITFLENYTNVKFPFQKMDFASIPPFQYGGMEHVGAIQYRASSLFLDKNATQKRKIRRAKLIAHETSHMWFGNLVTMRWFNDVWMKEVFANFIADKIMNPVFPEVNHNLNFMMTHYPSAYSEDRTVGTNSIRQHLSNLKDAGSLYGRIIYNKAPIMMRQLEYLMGEKVFKKGVQEYTKTYANSNADWSELITILDTKTTKDLKKWSSVWVNSPGRPIFSEEIKYNQNGTISKYIIYQKAEDNSIKVWPQSFTIRATNKKGAVKDIEIKNIEKNYDITTDLDGFVPANLLYNTNGFGYGVFPFQQYKINAYKNIKDDVSRGYQFINLYENMLLGNCTPLKTYKTYLNALKVEKNELISNYLTQNMSTIFWTFLTENQQKSVQEETENALLNLLDEKLPASLKKPLFTLYKSIACSKNGKNSLYKIWNKTKTFENLFLSETDYISLAATLAIFKHPKALLILKEQLRQIENPDRLMRFKWLLPALSNTISERNEFMNSLFKKENREKESWVKNALNYIHHPIRQKEALVHLKPIINALEDVQLTGDIFFPKGWLSSSIENHSSKEAFIILETFLKEHPNYNPILLKKLHQTTHYLRVAQQIKN